MRSAPDVRLLSESDEEPCEFCSTAVVVNDALPPRCICETDWKRRRLATEKIGKGAQLGLRKRRVGARENLEPVRSAHDKFPDAVYDLLNKLLRVDPAARLTAQEALDHRLFE
jgi:serine/threonine protein kinase